MKESKIIKLKDGSVVKIHENGDIEHAIAEEFLEENLRDNKNIKTFQSLEEYFKSGLSTGWHYENLEEELLDFISTDDRLILENPEKIIKVQLEIGDIVLIKKDDFIDKQTKEEKKTLNAYIYKRK